MRAGIRVSVVVLGPAELSLVCFPELDGVQRSAWLPWTSALAWSRRERREPGGTEWASLSAVLRMPDGLAQAACRVVSRGEAQVWLQAWLSGEVL